MELYYANDEQAQEWWDGLNNGQKEEVIEWLEHNPIPEEWEDNGWTEIDWAYTEGPNPR